MLRILTASDGGISSPIGDRFGISVAILGDTVVIGAYRDDDNGSNSGSAYIFDRNNSGLNKWGQVKKILPSDGAYDDEFGHSVAVSGNTVVVGAYLDDDSGSNSGSGYLFDRNDGGGNNWGQVNKILASDGAAGDQFGISVAISGDTVVVGANLDDDNDSSSGSAYIYE